MGKLGLQWIDNVWAEFHRLWTVRASVAVFVLSEILAFLPSFADRLNPRFLLVSFGILVAGIVFLRFVKQAPAPVKVPE